MPKPHLQAVQTGEVQPDDPQTLGQAMALLDEARIQVDMLTRDIAGKRLRIAQLEKDRDAEARENELWPHAVGVFRYWQTQTGHTRTRFTGDRFYLLAPFLKREGDTPEEAASACRSAIYGCVCSDFHMKRGKYANREGPRYDRLEQIFGSQDKFERFRDNDPHLGVTISQLTLLEHAAKVAERILERAKLIERALDGADASAVASLIVEIDRLNREWLDLPNQPL